MTRRRALFRLSFLATLVAGVAACASIAGFESLDFVADSDGGDGNRSDSSTDSPVGSSDARSDDADGGAVTPGMCDAIREAGVDGSPVLLCDDFERSSIAGGDWSDEALFEAEALGISDAQAASGSRSLYAAIGDPKDASVYLAMLYKRDIDAGLPLVVEFDVMMKSTQPTADPYSCCVLALWIGGPQLNGSEGLAVGRSGPTAFNPFLLNSSPVPVELAEMQWHHVLYRVDGNGFHSEVTPKGTGATTTVRTRSLTITTPPSELHLGISVGSGGGPARAYFDNVVIHQ